MVAELILMPGNTAKAAEASRQCARYVARTLNSTGLNVREETSLCTDRGELQKAIARALKRSNIVLILGGLSEEQNYVSKMILSEGLQLPLEENLECLGTIRVWCERTGERWTKADTELARLPAGSRAFPGSHGKIPGFAISSAKQHIIVLPDSQAEASAMLPRYVLPLLNGSEAASTVRRTVRAWGLNVEQTEAMLGAMMDRANPAVTLEQEGDEILIHVSAHGATRKEASSVCVPVLRKILEQVGDAAYGLDVDSLQSALVQKLKKKSVDLAVVESGTGGILTRVLSETAGGSDSLRYSVAADTDAAKIKKLGLSERLLKKHGGISEQAAVALADAARKKGDARLGVAVTACTGRMADGYKKSDKSPVGLVYIAVSDEENVYVKKLVVGNGDPGERDAILDATLSRALNMVRLFVDYLPGAYTAAIPLSQALQGRTVTGKAGRTGNDGPSRRFDRSSDSFLHRLAGNFIIRKADEPRDKVRKVIFILAVLVFLASGGYVAHHYYESFNTRNQSRKLVDLYSYGDNGGVEISRDFPSAYLPQFAALWSLNQDVVGYINIEGTQIEYPVMRRAEDRSNATAYYLRRDFYGKNNQYGIPFLDWRAEIDGSCDNYVIYGHNMKDGQMFGELVNYGSDIEFYRDHPVVEFNTLLEENEYKIFSVFITNTLPEHGEVFNYHDFLYADSSEDFNKYVSQVRNRSILQISDDVVDVRPGDKLVTLSTCTYEFSEARFVVVARQVRKGESSAVDTARVNRNPSPLYPDIWYQMYGGSPPIAESATVVTTSVAVDSRSSESSSQPSSSEEEPRSQPVVSTTPSSVASSQVQSAVAEQPSAPAAASAPEPPQSSGSVVEATERTPEDESSHPDADEDGESQSGDVFFREEASAEEPSEEEREESRSQPSLFDALRVTRSAGNGRTLSKGIPMTTWLSAASLFDGLDIDPPGDVFLTEDDSGRSGSSSSSRRSSGGSLFDNLPGLERDTSSSGSGGALVNSLTVYINGVKTTASPQEIVERIVQAEMGHSFHEEALKAQAVAAYSYILSYNNAGNIPTVIVSSASDVNDKVRQAVKKVLGETVRYQNAVAFTPYHATSAGQTTSSADVWGGSYPYLVPVDSSVDERATYYKVKRVYSSDQISSMLYNSLGIETWGDPSGWFEVLTYYAGGYVGEVSVCGETKSLKTGNTITGRMLRENVLGLRSSFFTTHYNSENDQFTFVTYGYGHGVGMSQNGANFYAQDGWDYRQILEHYYPGTRVV